MLKMFRNFKIQCALKDKNELARKEVQSPSSKTDVEGSRYLAGKDR